MQLVQQSHIPEKHHEAADRLRYFVKNMHGAFPTIIGRNNTSTIYRNTRGGLPPTSDAMTTMPSQTQASTSTTDSSALSITESPIS